MGRPKGPISSHLKIECRWSFLTGCWHHAKVGVGWAAQAHEPTQTPPKNRMSLKSMKGLLISRPGGRRMSERRQSGLKTGGCRSGWKNFIFSGNFTEKFDFSRQISEEFRLFYAISQKFDLLGNLKKIRFKKSRFFRQLKKNFVFLGKFGFFYKQFQANRFFRANSQKYRLFSGNFLKKFHFPRQIFQKFRILGKFIKKYGFQGKIGYLQLFLGKLFYFSLKVTTFEHTSCTW